MVDSVRFEVKGFAQLGANLRELGAVMEKKIAGQMTGAAARLIKDKAKQNVRRSPSIDTGSLLDAIIVKKLGKSASEGLTSAHIVTPRHRKTGSKKTRAKQQTAPHAGFVEWGTVKMPAEPYLGPALANNVGAALEAMRAKGESALKIAAARLKK